MTCVRNILIVFNVEVEGSRKYRVWARQKMSFMLSVDSNKV